MTGLNRYAVWDAPTRAFHWINVLCVLGLAGVGVVLLNATTLGIGNPGKLALKSLHSGIGYVFAVNLLLRVFWAFAGNRYARWSALLPGGRGYGAMLRRYVAAAAAGRAPAYLGHDPLGRIAVAVLLLLLIVQALTGLLLAGTDLFYPPFGGWIAAWIAAPGVDPGLLQPYAPQTYDAAAYESMRALRKPFAVLHVYGFYALAVGVVLHVTAIVLAELRQGGGIVSAMLNGHKILAERPADSDDAAA